MTPTWMERWEQVDPELQALLVERREQRVAAYIDAPDDIREHARIEQRMREGGYRDRPLLELIQNGADAIGSSADTGTIEVVLTPTVLYVANTGAPLDQTGLVSLLQSHMSGKRGAEIGRFGLGFKSVLSLTDSPRVLSRSVCIEFSRHRSTELLRSRGVAPPPEGTPVLRVGWELPADEAFGSDPILTRLGEWADTIVVLPLAGESTATRLSGAMASFPAEFLLFCGSEIELRFVAACSPDPVARTVSCIRDGAVVTLHDEGEAGSWRVLRATRTPPAGAVLEDAGDTFGRAELPLIWAVPDMRGKSRPGHFWAFFPLAERSRVPGILNAPWKTSDDRTSMLAGAYNEWLIRCFAELITKNLASFAEQSDPGLPLDYLPRRDDGGAFAELLAEAVWEQVPGVPIVADGTSTLRRADELDLPPLDDVDANLRWLALTPATQQSTLVHPTVRKGRERLGRWRRLRHGTRDAGRHVEDELRIGLGAWLELAARPDAGHCIELMQLVAAVDEWTKRQPRTIADACREEVRDARILLIADGTLAAANSHGSAGLYLPGDQQTPPGARLIDQAVASHDDAARVIVEVLGVLRFDSTAWATHLAAVMVQNELSWEEKWHLLLAVPHEVALSAIGAARRSGPRVSFEVPCLDGEWRVAESVLRPGELASLTEARLPRNRAFFADSARIDNRLLDAAGTTELPREVSRIPWGEELRRSYRGEAQDKFECERLTSPRQYSKPQSGYVGELGRPSYRWPLDLLPRAETVTRSRVTRWLTMNTLGSVVVRVGHTTRTDKYPVVDFPSWEAWLVRSHGMWEVCGKFIPTGSALFALNRPWGHVLAEIWESRDLLHPLGQPPFEPVRSPRKHERIWDLLEATALRLDSETDRFAIYRDMAAIGYVPSELRMPNGAVRIEELYVTNRRDRAVSFRSAGLPVLDLENDGARRFIRGGARRLADEDELHFRTTSSAVPFEEAFFELQFEQHQLAAGLPDVVFGDLRLRLGETVVPLPGGVQLDGQRLLVDSRAIQADRSAVLDAVVSALREAGTVSSSPGDAPPSVGAELTRRRRVAEADTAERRLILATGGTAALLNGLLPALRRICVQDGVAEEEIARLFLATHGSNSLRALSDVLKRQGLGPPSRWTGTGDSLAFVRSLGFPDEFAGGVSGRRSAWEEVRGPIPLKPLHDFQSKILEELGTLFSQGTGRRRAIVSLPTGAGKTRVLVEALVRRLLTQEGEPLVLWVAQQDELCEQAVQCFDQVWTNLGDEGRILRISRLWGCFGVGLEPTTGSPQVVVATIQTLNRRFGSAEVDWVARAQAIVIDEAHGAITPSYTGLLKWLDSRDGADPAPVVGLTATPFRGFDESETERLSRRFDGRLIPPASEQVRLYERLQHRGVLARVRHSLIECPGDFALTEEETASIETFSRFPDTAAARLGHAADRNAMIVSRLLGLPNDQKVLLFACSVEHAQLLAGLLNLEGCSAAAIWGETRRGLRRSFIREFLHGDLRVLTNYGVLTTGFDAPKVDVIAITRPTFSPALYQQMIGRGLRGPLNGGKPTCELINVLDNRMMYGERLAFHHFADLWEEPS